VARPDRPGRTATRSLHPQPPNSHQSPIPPHNSQLMVNRRVFDDEKHIHFVTFSCYKRRRCLESERAKRIVIGHLGSLLAQQNGMCLGYVIMPNHVHAMVWFPETGQLSLFMNKWKSQSSHALKELYQIRFPRYCSQINDTDPFWQARYYGFNIWSYGKFEEKLRYMHENPVKADLVDHPGDWPWSSARWYLQRKSVGLPIQLPPGLETDDRSVVRG